MDVLNEITESFEKELCNKADLLHIPIAATFELTPLCNLDCQMCYIHHKSQEVKSQGGLMDIDFWVHLAKQAADNGLLFLLLTGGEPFSYPNFKELYIKLKQLGIYIAINTNGTLITKDTVEWLKEYPPRRLNISLYGSSNETYERLCKDKKGFTKVTSAIQLLKQNNIMMRISHVRTPENIDDYQQIISFCNRNHLHLSVSYYMFPPIRKYNSDQNNKCRLSAEQAAQCAYEYSHDQRTPEEFDRYLENTFINNFKQNPLYGCDKISCRAGNSTFWINWKGEMMPCGIMGKPVIDLKNYSVKEGWKAIRNQVEDITLSSKCAICDKRSYCMICAGAAIGETGSFSGTPQYLCDLTNSYVGKLRKEYERRKNEIQI